MSELADRGKPERAAYYLKKNTPSACTQQLPALWCAIQNVWAVAEVLVCLICGTGRSPLGELDEWSLELAGQHRALSRQTRWSTQVRFWLTVWIFTVKVRWPQLRSLIAVLDGLLSPGGGFLVFLWIGGDGVGHGCLGRGGGAVDAGRSWRQVPLGAPHTAESPVRQSVQLPGPGGQLEDEKDREWERYSGYYLLNMPTTMSPRSFVFFSRGQRAAMGHINYVPASVLKRGSLKEFGQVFTHTSSLFPGAW